MSKGRGSKEATEKRRAARALNSTIEELGATGMRDGRTERRRKRLLGELLDGRRGTPLKAIDFVTHVDELLKMGETVAALRRQGVKPRRVPDEARVRSAVARAQTAYRLDPRAWRLLGIDLEAPESAQKTRRAKRG